MHSRLIHPSAWNKNSAKFAVTSGRHFAAHRRHTEIVIASPAFGYRWLHSSRESVTSCCVLLRSNFPENSHGGASVSMPRGKEAQRGGEDSLGHDTRGGLQRMNRRGL